MLALVLQLRFEHAPTGIQHGLCHPCLHQLQAAHVANDDILILINNLPRKLVQSIGTAARRFTMNPFRVLFVTSALRVG